MVFLCAVGGVWTCLAFVRTQHVVRELLTPMQTLWQAPSSLEGTLLHSRNGDIKKKSPLGCFAGNSQYRVLCELLLQGDWTMWPLKVPSKANYSMILWTCWSLSHFEVGKKKAFISIASKCWILGMSLVKWCWSFWMFALYSCSTPKHCGCGREMLLQSICSQQDKLPLLKVSRTQ